MTQSSAAFPIHSILDASHSQCQMMTEDMQRLNQIINEAIPTIIDSFNTMYECMEKQGVLSEKLLGGDKDPEHSANWKKEYKTLENESARSLDQVLIALQFQDMVNQLTQNMVKRLTIMQDLFQETVSDVIPAAYSEAKAAAFKAHDSIEKRISLLNELTSKTPVAQDSIDTGDIDLF